MMPKYNNKKPPFFYGWTIVGVSFVTLAVCFGVWYSFSVFFVVIVREFQLERGAVAGVFSLFIMVYSLMAVAVGSLLDRFGPRLILPAGSLLVALGLFASSRVHALWHLYLTYGLLTALGICAIGHISHSIFLANWFQRKRGLAFGIAMSGIGVGMLVLVPFSQWVIARSGWRNAYCMLAAIVLFLVFPLNALLQRKGPEEVGALPDGEQKRETTNIHLRNGVGSPSIVRPPDPPLFKEILVSGHFWLLFAVYFLTASAVQGTLIHQVAYLVDKGFPGEIGAFFFGLVGIIGSGGKILMGCLSDRTGRGKTFLLSISCALFGTFCLLAVEKDSRVLLYGYAILFGLGYGAVPPLLAAFAADLYHGKHFGRIFGVLSIAIGLGAASGSWASGKIYDATGSYRIALLVAAVTIVLVIFIFSFGFRSSQSMQKG